MLDKLKIDHLKEEYLKLDDAYEILNEKLEAIEKILRIILPNDLKEIAKFFRGYSLGGYEIYPFYKESTDYSIIDKILSLRRESEFPNKYIMLCNQEDAFICMETQDHPDKDTPIIYASTYPYMNNFIQGNPLVVQPDIFKNFTDFFEWLIEQEKQNRLAALEAKKQAGSKDDPLFRLLKAFEKPKK